MTLEETFEKIDKIMDKLSDDELPLEDSFGLYKEGMELLSGCRTIIEDVEKRVELLASGEEIDTEEEDTQD